MQTLRKNVSKFITTILQLYSPLPFQLSADLHTINAYLNTYEEHEAYLMQHYIERLQSKVYSKLEKERSKIQKQIQHYNTLESNKENRLTVLNQINGNKQKFNNNQSDYTMQQLQNNQQEEELTKRHHIQPKCHSKEIYRNNKNNSEITHSSSKSSLKIKLKPKTSIYTLLKEGANSIKEMLENDNVILQNDIRIIESFE